MTTNRTNYIYPAIGMGLILSAIIFVVVLVPRWTFRPPKPRDLRDYTAQELRGRKIFTREGCWYCHSSVSRPQDWDNGPKSKSSDYYYDEWHLVGSERSGPDLANIGGKFPDEYHIAHHQNPRSMKPGSNMPRFDYLNMQELVDLTAFLQSLGVNGTRHLDPAMAAGETKSEGEKLFEEKGETKWAKLVNITWPDGPLKGTTEKIAIWKDNVRQREVIAEEQYNAHPETPYKYTAEIEELMYGTSHEAQNSKTVLKAIASPTFANEELLKDARAEDPNVKAWTEVDFKEPDVMPTDPVAMQAIEKRRTIAEQGRGLFNSQCSTCHGLAGNGHGLAAPSMTKRPANFQEAKYNYFKTDTWYWRVSRGVPSTQMPQWELTLAADQRLYLVAFLKYVSQNGGLGHLKGKDDVQYGQPPSAAQPAASPAAAK